MSRLTARAIRGSAVPLSGSAAEGRERDNLIRLREWRSPPASSVHPGVGAVLFTIAGAVLGGILGEVQSRVATVVPRAAGILQVALPALLGGGVGALMAWARAKGRLAQSLATSNEFRRRIAVVERNQALWVSLSAVLHDIRNPLHALTLLLESLDRAATDTAEVRRHALDQLATINLRIRRVMDQVSALSGEIRRHRIAVASVAQEVTAMISPLARQSGVEFRFEAPDDLFVQGDDRLLVQALDHLVLNSLQILADSGREGTGLLHVAAVDEGRRVCIGIRDNGPGLPPNVRERPFEPLEEGERCGMGLGLAIARALAQAAGGDLDLASTGPEGTEFRLCLDKS
ncbi:MAG: sensor histidine kinase [Acidiferrobacteraceae bacterium]